MNGTARALAFNHDGHSLFSTGGVVAHFASDSSGAFLSVESFDWWFGIRAMVSSISAVVGDGQIYVWDARTLKCAKRHVDDGCINGKAIAVSPNGQYYAAGCE